LKGLAIIGGEGPGPARCRELAAAVDMVAAADSGLVSAEEAGVSPGWIVGDMDSIDTGERLAKYPPEKVLCYPADKDFTDTELALNLLWEKGCSEIWLCGGGGGRLDHLLAIRALFEREKTPCRWVTSGEDIFCLDAGPCAVELRAACPAGTMVSVFPVGDNGQAQSSGLKWPLDVLRWNRGNFGISNRTTGSGFSITVTRGRFLVVLPIAIHGAELTRQH
jgi:thiamine pyrophosphokinase